MRIQSHKALRRPLAFSSALLLVAACGGDDRPGPTVTCGEGTSLQGSVCVAEGGTTPDAGGPVEAGADASVPDAAPVGPTFAGVAAVSPASTTSLLVSWKPATSALTSTAQIRYRVFVATASGNANFAAPTVTTPAGATSIVLPGLPDSDHYVVVRAVDANGTEDTNKVEKKGRPAADTTKPTFEGVSTADTAPNGGVSVHWKPATDDMTAPEGLVYFVYAGESAGTQNFAVPAAVSDPGATSVTVTLPKPNTPYSFIVRARDAAGNEDTNSAAITGTSGPDAQPPSFGGCLSATSTDATSATLTWKAAVDDTTPTADIAYNVYASKSETEFDFAAPVASFTGVTTATVQGLAPTTKYYYVCRAVDLSGNEEKNTSTRSATTLSDSSPPTFAGITGTTGKTSTGITLTWNAAMDDQTAQADIVYDVFESTTAGGQVFTSPPKVTSEPGATSVALTGLTPVSTLYWVVRARDKAGNRDTNVVEQSASTGVSFSVNVQPIFSTSCAVSGCHVAGTAPGGLILSAGYSYPNLYDVQAVVNPTLKRVKAGDASASFLYAKISGTQGVYGQIMPPSSTGNTLTTAQISLIQRWINEGALRD
ncbi:MAG: hypothetical protein U0169_13135 [Polyangiaceae bacterium]